MGLFTWRRTEKGFYLTVCSAGRALLQFTVLFFQQISSIGHVHILRRRVNKLQLRIPDVMTTVKDCDFTRVQVDFILRFAECVFGSGYITHSFVFPIPPPHLHKCSWMFIYESMNGSLIAEMNLVKVRNLFQVCV